jgi:glycosyltransferase involved in cell wall biosynthesis
VVEQLGLGPAAARNAGAEAASAPWLIFLDDDVEPMPGLVQAHVEAGRHAPDSVVIGPYPPYPMADPSFFRLAVRHWWDEHFRHLARPGHRYSYKDLLTGNMSISAQVWSDLGGLDPHFQKAREDYELGLRLIKAGIPFRYVPDAIGFHHEYNTLTLKAAFRRAFEEGRSDVLLGQKHPEIRGDLRLVRMPAKKWLHRPLFRLRGRLDGLADLIGGSLLPVFQRRLRLRPFHNRLFRLLQHYWYVRGVAEHLRSFREWRTYVHQPYAGSAEPEITLDLREGLSAAEAYLDQVRPREVTLRYGAHVVGRLPASAGSERWRGAHLRPAIRDRFGIPYLRAAVLDGLIEDLRESERRQLAQALGELDPLRQRAARQPWVEQLWQWRRERRLSAH